MYIYIYIYVYIYIPFLDALPSCLGILPSFLDIFPSFLPPFISSISYRSYWNFTFPSYQGRPLWAVPHAAITCIYITIHYKVLYCTAVRPCIMHYTVTVPPVRAIIYYNILDLNCTAGAGYCVVGPVGH